MIHPYITDMSSQLHIMDKIESKLSLKIYSILATVDGPFVECLAHSSI